MMIALVTPVLAVLIGSFYGEKPGPEMLGGGTLILASVFLNVFRPLLRQKSTSRNRTGI